MDKPTRIYSAASQARRLKLLIVVPILLLIAIVMQRGIDPTIEKLHENDRSISAESGLNNEFMLLPLLGFREAAAGLLWVRCDEFFHSGDYDAILPLVRVITWLDPHADNIYVTGAWHLDYNFTDSSERSDRRYIAPAMALLDEGIHNNMNIPDIKFEKGWQQYDKVKDYAGAESAFLLADQTPPFKGNDDYPYGAPLKTVHILAHTYEKQGRIPEALATWQRALDRSAEMLAAKKSDYGTKQLRAAEQHNHDELLQRYHDRYTTTGHDPKINPSSYPAVIRPDAPGHAPSPWDVSFQPKIDVTRPKVFKISGQFNAADGARIDVRITDWDYKERPIGPNQLNNFDIDLSQTILMDSISVRKNHFEREMDMSKDPKMYSFSGDAYKVILSYNPRATAPHLQDRFGWSGEGMTDSNASHIWYNKNPMLRATKLIENQGGDGPLWDGHTVQNWSLHSPQPPWPTADKLTEVGQPPRMIKVTYKITKDQVQGLKPITDKDIVPND